MRIQWDTGSTNSYRMGKEGKYDLKLAGPPPVPESSEEDEEDMKGRGPLAVTAASRLNPYQSSPSLTILVPVWFIIISLVFSYPSKVLFSGFLQFNVDGQSNSK